MIGKYEKQKKPVRVVRNWVTGDLKERKISELCQYCPNEGCDGCLRKDSSNACLTMKKWRNGRKSLVDAIGAKYYQNERHKNTDEFREWVFERVLEAQGVGGYDMKSMVGTFASEVAKGESSFSFRGDVYLNLPKSLCRRIERKRPDWDGYENNQ